MPVIHPIQVLASLRQSPTAQEYIESALLCFIASFLLVANPAVLTVFYVVLVLLPFLVVVKPCHYIGLFGSKLFFAVGLWIGWMLLSGLWSTPFSLKHWNSDFYAAFLTFSFVVIVAHLVRHRQGFTLRLAIVVLLMTSVTTTVAIIYHLSSGLPFTLAYNVPRPSGIGLFSRVSDTANMLAIGILLGYFFLINQYQRFDSLRIASWLAIGISTAILFLTTYRSALLALVSALFITGLVNRRTGWLISSSIILLITATLYGFGHYEFQDVYLRTDTNRLETWKLAFDLIGQQPWLGYGLGTPIELAANSHNDPKSVLLFCWIVAGLPAFLLLLLVYHRLLSGFSAQSNNADGRLALGIFLLVFSLTDSFEVISLPVAGWLYFWLPFAILMATEPEPVNQQNIA